MQLHAKDHVHECASISVHTSGRPLQLQSFAAEVCNLISPAGRSEARVKQLSSPPTNRSSQDIGELLPVCAPCVRMCVRMCVRACVRAGVTVCVCSCICVGPGLGTILTTLEKVTTVSLRYTSKIGSMSKSKQY